MALVQTISIYRSNASELIREADKMVLNLTERAVVDRMFEFLSERLDMDPVLLRAFCKKAVRTFEDEYKVDLHRLSLLPSDERFDALIGFKLVCNQLVLEIIEGGQVLFNDAINDFFNKYLRIY